MTSLYGASEKVILYDVGEGGANFQNSVVVSYVYGPIGKDYLYLTYHRP